MNKLSIEERRKQDDKSRFNKYQLKLYDNSKVEGIDYVKCPFCEKRFLYLGSHFTNVHNITIKEYRKSHPIWESRCKVFIESRRKGALDAYKNGRKHSYDLINPKVEKEEWDFIYCKLCNKPFRNLGNHLKSIHKIDAIEYLNKFPNTLLIALKTKENNKVLLKKPMKERIGEERANKIVKHTKELKIKNGTNKHSIETRLKISKANTGKKQSLEAKQKQSNSLREGYSSGRLKPTACSIKGRQSYYLTPTQGTKLLRSFTELKYAQILDLQSNCGKDFLWLYEPIPYKIKMKGEEVPRTLTPDFQILFDWDIDRVRKEFGESKLTREQIQNICNRSYDRKIEETKGRWIESSIEFEKWNNFIEQYPDEKVEMIMQPIVNERFKKHFGHLVDIKAYKKYHKHNHNE
jgi:hypothetical protein